MLETNEQQKDADADAEENKASNALLDTLFGQALVTQGLMSQ